MASYLLNVTIFSSQSFEEGMTLTSTNIYISNNEVTLGVRTRTSDNSTAMFAHRFKSRVLVTYGVKFIICFVLSVKFAVGNGTLPVLQYVGR